MKILRTFLVLIVMVICTSAFADNRSVILVQQQKPGHIIYVSLIEKQHSSIYRVVGMGHSKIKLQGELPDQKFDEIWELAISDEISQFVVEEDVKTNMADPKYYTITFARLGETDFRLQIPVTEDRELVKSIISLIPNSN